MKYVCPICGYVYDEEKEGVDFSNLQSDWKCPICGAEKQVFEAQQIKTREEIKVVKEKVVENQEELKKYSVGELAAICSNLARGCEKQYLAKESGLYKDLAVYFDSVAPEAKNASLEELAESLKNDIAAYTSLRANADANKDRGTARVCVWGEKVTRMLSNLVDRYLKEGEKMLENTNVWICTVCGFVYIGENAPELCPVCKVPSWKFEKIEGGNK